MQTLRDTLLSASQRFESLWNRCEQDLKDFKTYVACSLEVLKEKITANECAIVDQKKTSEDLHKQLQNFHVIYSSKDDVQELKKGVSSQVNDATTSHLTCLQELQREIKTLINFLKDDFLKFKTETENKFVDLIENIEKKLYVSKMDRDGVLKEVRIYEKTIFIIEKKIENIYTLIERINKRGELCHKPE